MPICEAYLAFLESNGNREAYWRVLSDAGLTRERLESFDRPITLEPDWWADKKDALIREFRNYLGILKAVHSGADLQASASAAGNRVPDAARGFLGYVLSHVRRGKQSRRAYTGEGEAEWEQGQVGAFDAVRGVLGYVPSHVRRGKQSRGARTRGGSKAGGETYYLPQTACLGT